MFDVEFTAQIKQVKVTAKPKDGHVRRVVVMTLAREFDWMIAQALGRDARTALQALSARGISDVTIPMDAIVASGHLKALTSSVAIPIMRGLKAKGTVGVEPDDEPTVRLEFEFDFLDEAWVFLGKSCAAYAQITLSRLQTGLFGADSGTPSPGAEKSEA